MNYNVMRAAFEDELQKIAGEMHGFTRIGRKPIGVERLLERELESETTPSEVAPAGITEKTSAIEGRGKYVVPAVAGAALYHMGRQANEDRKMGKAMRKQQQY